ncbi:YtxH domain-containing protein [Candidatus Gottesmanbacteria bacterium]|nr:YtxH domain-containing protein [Candidatus Gottesmanbacteria bacterium]
MSNDNHHDNRFWFGFFLGGLLGALILFFMGTKEGKKTGKLLEDKIEEIEKRGLQLKEDVKEEAAEKLDDALAHIEKLQEQSVETTKHIRSRFFKNLPKRR